MIVVVLAEVAPLLVELLDVCLEDGQGERVERQDVLSVLGLAVRFDHPAVHDDAGHLDRERARVEVEQIPARARQLAAPHATAAATGYQQRPATAHNARAISGNLGYVQPEKRQSFDGAAPSRTWPTVRAHAPR